MSSSVSVVIAGAGNLLAADDGVGAHVVRDWPERLALPTGVRLLEIGTAGPAALALLGEREAVVLVDAARGGGPPGSVYRIDLGEIGPPVAVPLSVHDLGVGELAREARLLGRPLRGVLLGVEPGRLAPPGAELSPAVAAVVPRVQEEALAEAERLLGL